MRIPLTQDERDTIFNRDMGICQCCGLDGSEVHHIIPCVYEGDNDVNNLVLLCHPCHKHAPDSKEKFEEYKDNGGYVVRDMLGAAILCADKEDMDYKIIISVWKRIFKGFQEACLRMRIEKYGIDKFGNLAKGRTRRIK